MFYPLPFTARQEAIFHQLLPSAEVFNHPVVISKLNICRSMQNFIVAEHPKLGAVNIQSTLNIQDGTEYRRPRCSTQPHFVSRHQFLHSGFMLRLFQGKRIWSPTIDDRHPIPVCGFRSNGGFPSNGSFISLLCKAHSCEDTTMLVFPKTNYLSCRRRRARYFLSLERGAFYLQRIPI